MKKQIHKKILLFSMLALFAFMAIGSGSSGDADQKSLSDVSGSGAAASVTIDEQILLDESGIRITAKEFVNDSIWGQGIKVLIENETQKNVTVGCDALIVNDYMISDLFAASVSAGKKSNETLYLSSSELKSAGIDSVGQVEIYFHVSDSDTYDKILDSCKAVVKTSAFDRMKTTPNDDGKELYNENGIRIVGKYVDENSFWGAGILLYIENGTEQNVSVSCENVSVNGFMVSPFFYSLVYGGKKAVDDITLFSSDLEKNGITEIETVELSFHIYNADTYKTIADTAPITFTTK